MENKERIGRLIELKKMLDKKHELFPNVEFKMRVWGEEHSRAASIEEGSCGTAACAFGHAALHAPFKKLGLGFKRDEMGSQIRGCRQYAPYYKEQVGFHAASEFFGLELSEAKYLFDPDSYGPSWDISPKRVGERVCGLIKQYSDQEKAA